MKNRYLKNVNKKLKICVAILISDKLDLRMTKDKRDYHISGLIQQKDKQISNMHIPNDIASKYIKQKLTNM